MKKRLEICGKEYEICTSAYAMFVYKKEFNTGMMADIGRLQEFAIKQNKVIEENKEKTKEEIDEAVGLALMTEVDTYIEVSFRIAYAFIKCANPGFMSFDEWIKGIQNFDLTDKWVAEVTELAVNSFLGQRAEGTAGTTQV